MYCPKCGQSQVSADVRFCSRCGFPLVVVGDLLVTGGALPGLATGYEGAGTRPISQRRRGVKQGIGLFLSGVLLLPFFAILHDALGLPGEFALIGAIVMMLAVLRIIYAVFFEETAPQFASPPPQLYTPPIASRLHATGAESLPQAQGTPAHDYRQPPVQTAEMMRPPSVTDHTTRLLDKQTDSSEQ